MSTSTVANRKRFPSRLEVTRTERLTPHMQRVVLGGPGFDAFRERCNGHADSYVKVLFPREGVRYPEPLDMEEVRETLPVEDRPAVRTYTVRWVDDRAAEIAIDFVVHGDQGVAGPWSLEVRPGTSVHLLGPGGAYSPSPDADWHLLAGDEAALPAVQAALESMPPGTTAHALLEVDGPEDEQKIETAAHVDVTWLHRNGAPAGTTTLLADAVKGLAWPDGRAQVFVHGEAGLLKALRSYLLHERGVERDLLSLSGYWRRGNDEENFRTWKSEQAR